MERVDNVNAHGLVEFSHGARYMARVSLREEVERTLDQIVFPGFRHSIVRYGIVGGLNVDGGRVTVSLRPASARQETTREILSLVRESLGALSGVESVEIVAPEPPAPHHPHPPAASGPAGVEQGTIPGVRHIVAVSSCKGGVGKSTVAVNLAIALKLRGARVALMDADVYGPSAPLMFGVDEKPRPIGKKIAPIERYGVGVMSMGFFLDDSSPVIWRGPMVMGLIRQFLRDVQWGDQDYLIVDMPPGTGDAALTLAQQVPLSGALIVTTPQDVALRDVERGIAMFRQLHVPVLGVVENMSYYLCPDCGERDPIFGSGGGQALARRFDVKLLGELPLVSSIREGGDAGRPITIGAPDHPVSKVFADIAAAVEQGVVRPG